MKPDLRIIVTPTGRAATVDNARLQGLHIVRCDCHGAITCPSLDTLARQHEGHIPVGYTGEEITLDTHDEGFTLLLWAVVCTGALVTGYTLGQLIVQAVMR